MEMLILTIAGFFLFGFGYWLRGKLDNDIKIVTHPTSNNKPNYETCLLIVEDIMNYLIRTGFDFDKNEGLSIRDNLYHIVSGKLSNIG